MLCEEEEEEIVTSIPDLRHLPLELLMAFRDELGDSVLRDSISLYMERSKAGKAPISSFQAGISELVRP